MPKTPCNTSLASSGYSSNQPTDPLPNYFLASGFLLPVYEHSFSNSFIFTAATASSTFWLIARRAFAAASFAVIGIEPAAALVPPFGAFWRSIGISACNSAGHASALAILLFHLFVFSQPLYEFLFSNSLIFKAFPATQTIFLKSPAIVAGTFAPIIWVKPAAALVSFRFVFLVWISAAKPFSLHRGSYVVSSAHTSSSLIPSFWLSDQTVLQDHVCIIRHNTQYLCGVCLFLKSRYFITKPSIYPHSRSNLQHPSLCYEIY